MCNEVDFFQTSEWLMWSRCAISRVATDVYTINVTGTSRILVTLVTRCVDDVTSQVANLL